MNLILKTAAAGAAFLTLALPAAAQGPLCEEAPVIASLSSSVLEKRSDLAKLPARRFGSVPLYLLIRYASLSDEAIETELVKLLDGGEHFARDLAFAWYYGRDDALLESLTGPDAVTNALSGGNISAMRAMIREGDDELLIATIAGLDPQQFPSAARTAAIAIIDGTDRQKADLAELAMEHGSPMLAAAFVATEVKDKAWDLFVAKLDPETATEVTQAWGWLPALVGNPALPRTEAQGPAYDPEASARVHAAMAASMLQPQYDYLMMLLNYTARVDEVTLAADALRAAMTDGSLPRDGTLDEGWLLTYRILFERWDNTEDLHDALDAAQINTGREGRATFLDVLDWLVAIDALTPYLRGETAEPPQMPDMLSADFKEQWPAWLDVAAKVKADPADPTLYADETIGVVAEMLLAAGQIDWLATSVASAPASVPLLKVATDMAMRLDRVCESYLYHPTEGATLPGHPIFKFDAVTAGKQ